MPYFGNLWPSLREYAATLPPAKPQVEEKDSVPSWALFIIFLLVLSILLH
jgi:hypothetical protein